MIIRTIKYSRSMAEYGELSLTECPYDLLKHKYFVLHSYILRAHR